MYIMYMYIHSYTRMKRKEHEFQVTGNKYRIY